MLVVMLIGLASCTYRLLRFYTSRSTILWLEGPAASTLPGVTIARRFTTSSANDLGEDGFFLGVSSMMSVETSRRLESKSSLMLLIQYREKKEKNYVR